jgi:hypothetical protein
MYIEFLIRNITAQTTAELNNTGPGNVEYIIANLGVSFVNLD